MSNEVGAPKKWIYSGKKKVKSIRLTDEEVDLILGKFESIQAWAQNALYGRKAQCEKHGCKEMLCGCKLEDV